MPIAGLLAALLAGPAISLAAPATPLPPIESFFERPAFGGAILSPSARYLAARTGQPGGHDYLVVIDLVANEGKKVAGFKDADIGDFQWVNDDRLVFNATDKTLPPGHVDVAPGLYAVGRDGKGFVQLAQRTGQSFVSARPTVGQRELLPWHTFMLHQSGAQDSESIYVRSPQYDDRGELRYVDLLSLNTVTGRAQKVPRPGAVYAWLLDHKGEPRIAMTHEKDITTVFYRDPANAEWRKLVSYQDYSESDEGFAPLGFAPDGRLFVVAHNGKDTTAVHTFNFTTNKIDPEPVVAAAGYDFAGSLVTDSRKLLGVHYQTDAASSIWFDPDMKALQQAVDKALPGTINMISVAARAQQPWVLVRSFSDVTPSTYVLFNAKTNALNLVGSSHPAIDSRQMGQQDAVRYKARDGLEIPALLTLPKGGGKNLPLVVLVHGGPWVRGETWGWSSQSQFLASRGYAVLEPEFRGSTGFGWSHFKASFKQWGLAMQDDLADAARWAIAQGVADPKRICIAGASYGGYATLMGLIKDPDLFKCGVDWVGVTDINLMYNDTWYSHSDATDDWKKYGMPRLIGDQVKDAAQLKATSPLEQASRIKQPVLLAYGGVDRRVPIFHGRKFYDAIKETNKQVEWIEYPQEGHGWSLAKNNIDFWTRVENFLDKNIGKGAGQE
ncbi:alpha/beta hydrolase family protein [Massilia horti]|nr:S9 family peptidase [Massilia horti]